MAELGGQLEGAVVRQMVGWGRGGFERVAKRVAERVAKRVAKRVANFFGGKP